MTESNKWLLISGVVVFGIILYLLSPVLAPFMFAALLSYLGDPLVDRLELKGFSRTLGTALVVVFFGVVIILVPLLLLPVIQKQVEALVRLVPAVIDWAVGTAIPWLELKLGLESPLDDGDAIKKAIASHWRQAGSIAANAVGYFTQSGLALAGWLASMVLVPVVTFYLMRDWDHFISGIHDLIPRQYEPTVVNLAKESDEVLGAFLKGQLTVMLCLSAVYAVGLWLAGVELALVIGILAGLVSFVPYLGVIVGLGLGVLAVLVQGADLLQLVLVVAVFGVGQVLEGMVLTPLLVGDRIGLHPVTVMFAVLAGGQLFGFGGVLLALPVAAVIAVVTRHARERYHQSSLYKDTDGCDPPDPGAPPDPPNTEGSMAHPRPTKHSPTATD